MHDPLSNRVDDRSEQGRAGGELRVLPERYSSGRNGAPAGHVVFMPGLDHAAMLASLQESQTRHRLVMLATNDMIWDADLVTEMTQWSGAIEEILGYNERTHHDDAWFRSSLHPDDFDRVIEALDIAIGDPNQSLFESEYRFRCQDGSYKDIFAKGLIIRDEHGVGVRMVGSMMDYTAQKLAETVLVEARLQAEESQAAQAKFLANISHELRTPLTSILGLGELLLEGGMDPQQRAWAATMHRSAERLHAIINQFLDFSRTEAGFTVVEAQPFDLILLLEQLEAEFAPLADQKDISFSVEVSKDVDRILVGDALCIAQVLQNLLGNAIKFTKQGHVRLRVECADTEPGPGLRFIVADSGVGFSAEIQRDLFQSFRQADESVTREYGGTGLGLAICKQLAELMGGSIHAESGVGEGSTFTFVLPGDP